MIGDGGQADTAMTFDRVIRVVKDLGVPVAILAAIFWFGGPLLQEFVREVPQLRLVLQKLTGSVDELSRNVREGNAQLGDHRRMSEPWIGGRPPAPPAPPRPHHPEPEIDEP